MMNRASTNTTATASAESAHLHVQAKGQRQGDDKDHRDGSTIWMKLVSANWMVVMSDTVRVVMEACRSGENRRWIA